jgi:hypothetical protein
MKIYLKMKNLNKLLIKAYPASQADLPTPIKMRIKAIS